MTSGTLAAAAIAAAYLILLAALLHLLRQRARELELERASARSSPLVGRLVIANTPKPDDQAFRGVVTRELEGTGLVLTAATYLDREVGKGGAETLREVPAGDVVIRRVAWAQIIPPPQEA